MNKSEYAKLLLTENWNAVRKEVLKRDGYKCKCCGASNTRLSVHHKIYLEDKMPWEVPMKYLESLCDKCHEAAHEGKLISSFIKKSLPSNKPPKRKNRSKKKGKDGKKNKKIWIEGKGLISVPRK